MTSQCELRSRPTRMSSRCAGAILAILVLVGVVVGPGHAAASCGAERVRVSGSESEVVQACQALAEVGAYFANMGLGREPEALIRFSDRVFIRLYDFDSKVPAGEFQVSGYYDAERKVIEVTSATSTARRNRKPWGLDWDPRVAQSILLHELVHLFSREALGAEYYRVSKPWLEYIATAVQFELMQPDLRQADLSN